MRCHPERSSLGPHGSGVSEAEGPVFAFRAFRRPQKMGAPSFAFFLAKGGTAQTQPTSLVSGHEFTHAANRPKKPSGLQPVSARLPCARAPNLPPARAEHVLRLEMIFVVSGNAGRVRYGRPRNPKYGQCEVTTAKEHARAPRIRQRLAAATYPKMTE